MRLALKIAILASGKTQRRVAADAGLSENRLSEIVRGWADPRDVERLALAGVLGQPASALFDEPPQTARTQHTVAAQAV